MGSRISKAVRPHRRAAASPVAAACEGANELGRHDGPATWFPIKLARDDIDIETLTTTATPQRRNSAPTAPTPAASATNTAPSQSQAATMSELQTYHWNSRAAELATMAPPPPPPRLETPVNQASAEPEVQCLACCKALPQEKDPGFAKEANKPCSRCNSAYCIACMRDMFVKACTDISRMPPRCCKQIHLHQAKRYLSAEEIITFKLKYEEWSTPSPFYCPAPTCSTFIPERLLPTRVSGKGKRAYSGVSTPTSDMFPCQACATDICIDCRQIAHPGSMCAIAAFGVDAEMSALLKSWGYKRCPKCGHGLKRMYGCNQMQCRCSAQFCWICLGGEDECDGGCYDDEDQGFDNDDDDDDDDDDDAGDHASETESPTVQTSHSTSDVVRLDTQSPVTEPHHAQASSPNTINNTVPATTPNASSFTHPDNHSTTEASTNPTAPPQPAIRFRNLDGGSHDYWQNQDLNFGDEPNTYNQDRSWHCTHSFTTHKITFETALSDHTLTSEMECTKCWTHIHPEITPTTASSKQSRQFPTMVPSRHAASPHPINRLHRRPTRWDSTSRAAARVHERTADTISTLLLSQSVPARETSSASPMEDVQYTDQVVDTYGNVVSTTALDAPRRASIDVPSSASSSTTKSSIVFPSTPATFSLAYECEDCGLLVCHSCRDASLSEEKKTNELEIKTHGPVGDAVDTDVSSDCGF